MNIPPEDWPKVISATLRKLSLSYDEYEEAYSLALVLVTEAAASYDASRGASEVSWLARNIRWGISKFRRSEQRHSLRQHLYPVQPAPYVDAETRMALKEVMDSLTTELREEVQETLRVI